MSHLKNDRLIRALLHQPVDQTPIWIMRQAGRYLPEYRATRAKAGDFLTLCKTPELACEVTLQPIHRYPLDAAIIFSDILTIPDAMGLGLYFLEGEGPRFKHPLQTQHDIEKLCIPDVDKDLSYVSDAIRLVKKELAGKIPLIGFSGSPWTLACYMIENGASKDFHLIKKLMYQDPKLLHKLLTILSESVILYLNAQIAAGVDVVMLFDSWGGILSTECYQEFSLNYLSRIIAGLNQNAKKIPIILFTKGGGLWLEQMSNSGCDAIGLDWTIDIGDARQRVGKKVALQGNLDPAVLLSNPETIQREAKKILKSYGSGSGHIFNLGHGISQHVPPEHVTVLVETVHDFKLI